MKDPYETLGVERSASPDAVQKAYRRLAKKLHPDLNPGSKESEERFKELSVAYGLLSDADKRARYDRGEIDATGAEKPRQRFYKDFASDAAAGRAYENYSAFADFADSDDILSELFKRGANAHVRARGPDVHYHLPIEFLEAIIGGAKRLTLPDGGTLDVTIPAIRVAESETRCTLKFTLYETRRGESLKNCRYRWNASPSRADILERLTCGA